MEGEKIGNYNRAWHSNDSHQVGKVTKKFTYQEFTEVLTFDTVFYV